MARLEPALRRPLPRAPLRERRSTSGIDAHGLARHRLGGHSALAPRGAPLARGSCANPSRTARLEVCVACVSSPGDVGHRGACRHCRMGARAASVRSAVSGLDLYSRLECAARPGAARIRCGTGAATLRADAARHTGPLRAGRRYAARRVCTGACGARCPGGHGGLGVLRNVQRAAAHARTAGLARGRRRRGGLGSEAARSRSGHGAARRLVAAVRLAGASVVAACPDGKRRWRRAAPASGAAHGAGRAGSAELEPLGVDMGRCLSDGPVGRSEALVQHRVSSGGAFSRAAGNARGRGRLLRCAARTVGGAHPRARGTGYGVPGADGCTRPSG